MKISRVAGLAVLTLGMAGFATADTMCAGSYTLANTATATNGTAINATGVFGGNNGCTISGFDFSNFVIIPNTGYSSNGTGSINVTFNTLSTGFYLGINQGLGQDVIVHYDITPGPSGMLLSLNIPGIGTGTGSVSESICTLAGSGFASSCGSSLGSGSVSDVSGNNTLTTFIALTPGTADFVSKDISATSEVFQSVVPEPMSLSMMGLGLIGLGIVGRKFRK